MTENDPGRLADDLEQQADELDRQNAEVKDHIDEAREDWKRKRGDGSVPGAVPEDDEQGDGDEGAGQDSSPAAETPSEEADGPPADQREEEHDD